jgi:hypothetical protein
MKFAGDKVEIYYTQLVGENSRANFKKEISLDKFFRLYEVDREKLIKYLED